ncbi:MAG: hypothetical protein ABFS45_23220 [Pseudomonadota bacterium]
MDDTETKNFNSLLGVANRLEHEKHWWFLEQALRHAYREQLDMNSVAEFIDALFAPKSEQHKHLISTVEAWCNYLKELDATGFSTRLDGVEQHTSAL